MTPRSILLSLAVVVFFPSIGLSQQDAPAWRWTWDGNVFFGHNRQVRRFVDLSAWESQNWGMLAVDRPVRSTDRFTVMGMLSLEAFTIDRQDHVRTDLEFFYAPSRSFHVFIQWRPRTSAHTEHIH